MSKFNEILSNDNFLNLLNNLDDDETLNFLTSLNVAVQSNAVQSTPVQSTPVHLSSTPLQSNSPHLNHLKLQNDELFQELVELNETLEEKDKTIQHHTFTISSLQSQLNDTILELDSLKQDYTHKLELHSIITSTLQLDNLNLSNQLNQLKEKLIEFNQIQSELDNVKQELHLEKFNLEIHLHSCQQEKREIQVDCLEIHSKDASIQTNSEFIIHYWFGLLLFIMFSKVVVWIWPLLEYNHGTLDTKPWKHVILNIVINLENAI